MIAPKVYNRKRGLSRNSSDPKLAFSKKLALVPEKVKDKKKYSLD
jgi:hypothetical protein